MLYFFVIRRTTFVRSIIACIKCPKKYKYPQMPKQSSFLVQTTVNTSHIKGEMLDESISNLNIKSDSKPEENGETPLVISPEKLKIPSLEKVVDLPAIEQQQNHLAPYFYILGLKGKGFRKKLLYALNVWYKVEEKDVERISRVIDILHNSSLVIDDIEDGSELRRGQPAAHLKYGVPLSINAANYMYFEALRVFLEFENLKLVEVFAKHLLSLHHGQGMELAWRDSSFTVAGSNTIPTEEEYEHVIVRKTSGQFLFMTDVLRMLSKSRPDLDLTAFSYMVGVYFQIRDDFMNLTCEKYKEKKGFCEDISEGKLSFIVIHALNGSVLDPKQKQRLLDILKERTEDEGRKKEAFALLVKSGAFDYTKRKLKLLKKGLKDEIKRVGKNPQLELFAKTFWV